MSKIEGQDKLFVAFQGKMLCATVSGNEVPNFAGDHRIRVSDIFDHETGNKVEKTEELINIFKSRYLQALMKNADGRPFEIS